VAIYTLRGDCGSVRVAVRIVGGRVYSQDQSYRASGGVGANGVVRVASPALADPHRARAGCAFRRGKLAVIQRRMLWQLISLATRRLLLRVVGKVAWHLMVQRALTK
jgi:hypothetical protein